MSVQRVYVIHYPNNKCPDYTVLPLRSLPEKFGGPKSSQGYLANNLSMPAMQAVVRRSRRSDPSDNR